MLYRKFRMLRGHYAKMTRGLFPKRIIRYAGLTEPPMCTSAYLANVRPDHISSSYWFRSKKCSAHSQHNHTTITNAAHPIVIPMNPQRQTVQSSPQPPSSTPHIPPITTYTPQRGYTVTCSHDPSALCLQALSLCSRTQHAVQCPFVTAVERSALRVQ